MKTWKIWLLATLLGTSTAQSSNSGGPDPGNPDRGVAIFSAYCASCHGESGQGDGPMAPRLARDFNVKPTDFTLPAWQKDRSDGQLVSAVRGGGAMVHKTAFMPAWGMTLDEQQTLDLVSYMRELGKPAAGGYVPAPTLAIQNTLELGRTLFTLHCMACHGPRGKGDGPRLQQIRAQGKPVNPGDFSQRDFMKGMTDERLEEYAQSGIHHSRTNEIPEQNPWWHTPMNQDEIQSLTLYIRSMALRK